MSEIDWATIRAALAEPFEPADVDYRPQGKPSSRNGKDYARCLAYVDARAVATRLDDVVGIDGWQFNWEPVASAGGKVTAAKGTLAIHGISKSDVGDGDATETTKASVSDALKRCAVLWGLGRYLYGMPAEWAEVDVRDGKIAGLATGEITRLRAKLPRRGHASAPDLASAPAPAVVAAPGDTSPASQDLRARVQVAYPRMAAQAIAKLTTERATAMLAAADQRKTA